MNTVTIDDFHKLDIRVGKIIDVKNFPQAKKPAYKLTIDCGATIGIKQSGVPAENNTVILIRPDHHVPLGGKLY